MGSMITTRHSRNQEGHCRLRRPFGRCCRAPTKSPDEPEISTRRATKPNLPRKPPTGGYTASMFRFAQLTLSPDMLQAVLDLPAGCALNKESIAALLVQAGVRHGLVPQALLSCLTAVASDRTLVIAQGQAAEPVRSARLVPPLDPATLPKAVTTGTCLGRYVAEDPGRPGVGVDGQVILPDAPLSLHIGRGFDLTGDGLLVANRDGLVECDETGLLRVALQTVATRKLARVLVQLEFSATQALIEPRWHSASCQKPSSNHAGPPNDHAACWSPVGNRPSRPVPH